MRQLYSAGHPWIRFGAFARIKPEETTDEPDISKATGHAASQR